MSRANRLRMISFAGAAVLVAACGNGPGSGVQNTPASVGVSSVGSGKPLNAKPTPAGITVERIDRRLQGATGPIDVWVTLDAPSLAAQQAKLAVTAGLEKAKQLSNSSDKASFAEPLQKYRNDLAAQQSKMAVSLASVGAEELARVHVAHNAIAVRVDASQLEQLALIPGVAKVRPVLNYEMSLSETVPYVGGAAVQASGVTGSGRDGSGAGFRYRLHASQSRRCGHARGVRRCVRRSPGDPLQTRRSTVFSRPRRSSAVSTSSVKRGRTAPRTEDPDPIDFQGHGSHVADIIAGKSLDGTHVGVAPGAKLLGVKVCSAVATSCNGVCVAAGRRFRTRSERRRQSCRRR